jgi:hypothetical protein
VNQSLTEFAMDVRGRPGAPQNDSDWTYRFLARRANSIEGGTTEVCAIVAERVLGLCPRGLADERGAR